MFFLAKELGMTVGQLTQRLTREELIAWAAFFDIRAEEEEKARNQANYHRQTGAVRSR